MAGVLDRLLSRVADRTLADERCLVDDPGSRGRVLFRRDLGLLVFSLGVLLARSWVESPWLVLITSTVLGWFVGSAALARSRRATSYASGWHRGRLALLASAREAEARGLSPREWLAAEVERDLGRPW